MSNVSENKFTMEEAAKVDGKPAAEMKNELAKAASGEVEGNEPKSGFMSKVSNGIKATKNLAWDNRGKLSAIVTAGVMAGIFASLDKGNKKETVIDATYTVKVDEPEQDVNDEQHDESVE